MRRPALRLVCDPAQLARVIEHLGLVPARRSGHRRGRCFFLRPAPRWTRYATPIRGLWMCASGTHPGGGIMGACGANAARAILKTR